MQNIEMKIEGNKLTINVDLATELGLSKSGKSINIASTFGNVSIPGRPDVQMGLNIYKKGGR